MQDSLAGWWFRTWILFFHILGMSSSQLTNSYFQRGGLNHQPVVILPYVSWLDGTIVQLHRQCPSRGAQPISKWSYTKFASHFKAVLHYVSLILNHAHHHGQNYSMIAAVTFFCSFFFTSLKFDSQQPSLFEHDLLQRDALISLSEHLKKKRETALRNTPPAGDRTQLNHPPRQGPRMGWRVLRSDPCLFCGKFKIKPSHKKT